MTESLADESGEFRKGDDGVFSGEKCIFMAPSARLVSELMEQLSLLRMRIGEKCIRLLHLLYLIVNLCLYI